MIAALRRTTLVGVMVLVMLGGLIGWTLKVEAAPSFSTHFSSVNATHSLADGPDHYCPPPPFSCLG